MCPKLPNDGVHLQQNLQSRRRHRRHFNSINSTIPQKRANEFTKFKFLVPNDGSFYCVCCWTLRIVPISSLFTTYNLKAKPDTRQTQAILVFKYTHCVCLHLKFKILNSRELIYTYLCLVVSLTHSISHQTVQKNNETKLFILVLSCACACV